MKALEYIAAFILYVSITYCFPKEVFNWLEIDAAQMFSLWTFPMIVLYIGYVVFMYKMIVRLTAVSSNTKA